MEYLTPRKLATAAGIKVDLVLGWIRTGELRAFNTAANPNGARPRWRIAPADWDAFLERRANKPAEPTQPASAGGKPPRLAGSGYESDAPPDEA